MRKWLGCNFSATNTVPVRWARVEDLRVQSSYCQSASATVHAAFDSSSGNYRYLGQVLEVPKDQYEACVQLMRDCIARGKVPSVADPAAALVKQGTATYTQARNIARAGNVDCLVFDAKTQRVTATGASSVSSLITYAQDLHGGTSSPAAVRAAFRSALDHRSKGSNALITSIVNARWLPAFASIQLLRSKNAAIGVAAVRNGARALWRTLNTEGGREIIQRIPVLLKVSSTARLAADSGREAVQRIAAGSLGRAVSGAGALSHVSRLLRSNVITAVITTIVTSAPDFYRAAFVGSISWRQFAKNATVNAAAVAGGVGGWMGGMVVGEAVGSAVSFISTVVGSFIGGVVGGLAAGTGAQFAAKTIADRVVDDDAKELITAMEDEVQLLASEYMFTENEVEQIAAVVGETVNPKWLRNMYKETSKPKPSENPPWLALRHIRDRIPSFPRKRESSGRGRKTRGGTQRFQTASQDHARRNFVRTEFEPKFAAIIQKRPRVAPP